MRIYISGKITGCDRVQYLTKFALAEQHLRDKGYSVVNPAAVNGRLPDDTTYDEYMKMSMLMLSFCDAIYMLEDWEESRGARHEKNTAEKKGMSILFQKKGA